MPNQPSPPRYATSRSTTALSSAKAIARSPALRIRPATAGRPCATGHSGRSRRSEQPWRGHRRASAGSSSARYDRAATMIDRAPGTARDGSVEAFRVAIGERHPGIKTHSLPSDQLASRPIEHSRRSNTEMLDAVLACQRPELAERRQWLVGAHRISVRCLIGAIPPTTGSIQLERAGGSPARSTGQRPQRRRCDDVVSRRRVQTLGAGASNPCSEWSCDDHDEGVSHYSPPCVQAARNRQRRAASGTRRSEADDEPAETNVVSLPWRHGRCARDQRAGRPGVHS